MNTIKYILFGFFMLLLVACVGKTEQQGQDIKEEYKYTVWTGSATFAVGHNTDSYTKEDGMVTFTNKDGEKMSIPMSKIYKIDENK